MYVCLSLCVMAFVIELTHIFRTLSHSFFPEILRNTNCSCASVCVTERDDVTHWVFHQHEQSGNIHRCNCVLLVRFLFC